MWQRHLMFVAASCLLAATVRTEAGNAKSQGFPDPYKDPESFLRMRLRFADLMVKGTVLAVNDSVSTEEGFDSVSRTPGRLYTFVTLQVDSILKGRHDGPTLTFWQRGGRHWGYSEFSTVSSRFQAGRTVVVLLDSRKLQAPLAEGLDSPPYQFKDKLDHYVVREGAVYRAQVLQGSIAGSDAKQESRAGATPVFSLDGMFQIAGAYLRSASIESLAVKADVIATGQVLSRREVVDDGGGPDEVIEFGNGSIVKGETAGMPLKIRCKRIPKPHFGLMLDEPEFPDNERILVFLTGPVDGVCRPLSCWRAAEVLSGVAEEDSILQRISAVLGN